jgi:hypothetical protein
MHIFWVAGLLLALIDLPDFGTPLRSIAGSVEKIADATPREQSEVAEPGPPPPERPGPATTVVKPTPPPPEKPGAAKEKEHSHV